jgi:hypothetical protein
MKIYYYLISCKDPVITQCYVGSTNNYSNRCREHYSRCNNPKDASYNKKLYQFIRDNGGFDKWEIQLIDTIELFDKRTILAFEQNIIMFYNAELNSNLAY